MWTKVKPIYATGVFGLRGSDPIGGVRMVGWAFLCYTIACEKVTQFFYRSLLSPPKSCC
jgi:hypothetical protein